MSNEPKQHHYVPECYSKNFVNADGYLKVSDLWDGGRIFARKPESIFTKKYMYTQPVHAEGRYDNAIEHLLSRSVETNWTPIVERLSERRTINQTDWGDIVQFVASMLVRVPITFDSVVELLRESVARNIPKNLVSPPETLVEIHTSITGEENSKSIGLKELIDSNTVVVNIDPHRCVTSMAYIAANIPLFQPGFSFGIPQILHNQTDLPFLSSDNPVCFYGGKRNTKKIFPYRIQNKKSFSFVFPISSDMALVNSTFVKKNGMHVDMHDREVVADINRILARFSQRYVFGESDQLLSVGRKFQGVCPRPDFERSSIGNGVVRRIAYKFGEPMRVTNNWDHKIER